MRPQVDETIRIAMAIASVPTHSNGKGGVRALGLLMEERLAGHTVPRALDELVTSCLEERSFERPRMAEVLGTLEGLVHAERERKRSTRAAVLMAAGTGLVMALVGLSMASAP